MKLILRLAIRNIIRHKLRSLLSVGMISGSICAMVVFRGFSDHSIQVMQKIAAENQFGHIQIAEDKYWSPESETRDKRMFFLKDLEKHGSLSEKLVSVSGRVSFFGLVSNGDLSLGANIIGVDPQGEPKFTEAINMIAGKNYKNFAPTEMLIGVLLAKRIKAKINDDVTILSNTVDGVINALDFKIGGIFSSGLDEIDSQIIYIPLGAAQKILNTDKVDIAVGRFKNLDEAEVLTKEINNDITKNSSLIAKSWRELASLFRQVQKFYNMQNNIVEAILVTLMFLGILNAVSMTVVERTGEIGILRSMGETRSGIMKQFVLESILLTFVSVIIGILLSISVKYMVQYANIKTEMPGASVPFHIQINFLYGAALFSSFLAIFTVIISTIIPTYKAVQSNIVDCLKRNI